MFSDASDPAHNPLSAPPTLALAGQNLACRRGSRLLFTGLNIAVQAGEIVWLRGNNGRGKTSLLRLLAGLSPPDAGSLMWGTKPIAQVRDVYAQNMAYVAHNNALKDDLTSFEALGFLAALHGQDAHPGALQAALHTLGMQHKRSAFVRTLSQGQRRRVALARLALAPAKPLWLLDEPFDALDDEGCAVVNQLLCAHAKSGGAVVLTSHLTLQMSDPAPRSVWLDAAPATAALAATSAAASAASAAQMA